MTKTRIMIALNLAAAVLLVLTASVNVLRLDDIWVRIDGWLAIVNAVSAVFNWWTLCELKRGGNR